jgi:hypothetical protein
LIRAEEHPGVVGSSVDADLPTFEALSLNEPPLMTSQTGTDEETDDDCAEYAYILLVYLCKKNIFYLYVMTRSLNSKKFNQRYMDLVT